MYHSRLNERKEPFDWPLFLATVGLMLAGTAFIASATASNDPSAEPPWYQQMYFHQIIWYCLGLGAAAALCTIDYASLVRWSTVIYWVSIILLIAVFATAARNGGKRWIHLGISLQPSELAKIAFILLQASFLSRPAEELRRPKVFLTALGFTLLPFLLILEEPDIGSALVFLTISLAMMCVAGVPGRWLAMLVGGGGLLMALVVAAIVFAPKHFKAVTVDKIVKPYQQFRILTYFGPHFTPRNISPDEKKQLDKDLREKSYNVEQALISVGSGGFSGKGWKQGTQHSLGFLPSKGAHNDFIFSVIAEEEGFVGSVVILTLYAVLLFYGIKIAGQARDRLGRLLAIGVVTLLFSHVFINIGMNIRLMPVTGIPLPLLSYGGSSVVCSLIAIGLLHNIHAHRRSY